MVWNMSEPHHDNPSVAAGRHDEVMRELHKMDMELAHAMREINDMREKADTFCDWMQQDAKKSQWYYENIEEIRQLVESARWVKTFRRAVAWVIGAVAGTAMAVQQLEIWVRDHIQ